MSGKLTESSVDNAPIFGWRDITSSIDVRGVGANDPSWSQIGSSPFSGYDFALNDQCWLVFHIPHDIVPDEAIHFHAHWLADGTDANIVRWEWAYVYAKGFNQEAFGMFGSPNATIITAEEAAAGTAGQHMVTETTAITISGLDEPDGIIFVRVRRVTNGGTDNTDGIFLLTSDIHYKSNSLATISKSPGFYYDHDN